MQVLVLNTGSSSVKFEVFDSGDDGEGLTSVASGRVEGVGEQAGGWRLDVPGHDRVDEAWNVADHEVALQRVLAELGELGVLDDLIAVGHRVVHGGEDFTQPTLIDDDVVRVLERIAPLAPLHNPPALVGIEVARSLAPDVPHVAVFDTAFHASMPPEAYRYAVPTSWYRDHGVRRFGFHGTSHEYVYGEACRVLGRDPGTCKVITLHLGNGASAAAVDGGTVVDTSMGMSPLQGLVMGTRSGDIDPGVVFHMARAGLSLDDVERVLNKESGLEGIGGHNDVRRLVAAAQDGDEDAGLAFAMMTRRIRAYVGAYTALLGGLDAVVFTAGIGENQLDVRAEVIEPLGHLGLQLDPEANASVDLDDGPVTISPAGAEPVVMVVATDEEGAIARAALEVANAA